jgi:hypothetical protein
MNLTEYAIKHVVTKERIRQLVFLGRIPGAKKKGKEWVIPDDAPYPKKHSPWGLKKEKNEISSTKNG